MNIRSMLYNSNYSLPSIVITWETIKSIDWKHVSSFLQRCRPLYDFHHKKRWSLPLRWTRSSCQSEFWSILKCFCSIFCFIVLQLTLVGTRSATSFPTFSWCVERNLAHVPSYSRAVRSGWCCSCPWKCSACYSAGVWFCCCCVKFDCFFFNESPFTGLNVAVFTSSMPTVAFSPATQPFVTHHIQIIA